MLMFLLGFSIPVVVLASFYAGKRVNRPRPIEKDQECTVADLKKEKGLQNIFEYDVDVAMGRRTQSEY